MSNQAPDRGNGRGGRRDHSQDPFYDGFEDYVPPPPVNPPLGYLATFVGVIGRLIFGIPEDNANPNARPRDRTNNGQIVPLSTDNGSVSDGNEVDDHGVPEDDRSIFTIQRPVPAVPLISSS